MLTRFSNIKENIEKSNLLFLLTLDEEQSLLLVTEADVFISPSLTHLMKPSFLLGEVLATAWSFLA